MADKHGRMIATDTRGDQVIVFQPNASGPPTQVGVVPQPGGPYGITYDPTRDRVWVASSGTNEVIGYDMTNPQPREVARIATVQNPYTVGVDPQTGRLYVAGVSTAASSRSSTRRPSTARPARGASVPRAGASLPA